MNRLQLMQAIRLNGPATEVYISHGASGDWFVVEPQVGTMASIAGTPITIEMAVESLRRSGRTVYKVKVELWNGIDGPVDDCVEPVIQLWEAP